MKKLSKGEAEITIESFDQLKEMLSPEEIQLLKQGQLNTNILDAIAISLIDVCEKHNRELESCQASTALQMIIKMLRGDEYDFRDSIIDDKSSLGTYRKKGKKMDFEKIIKEAVREVLADNEEYVGKIFEAKENTLIAVIKGEAHSADVYKGQRFLVDHVFGECWLVCTMIDEAAFKTEPGYETLESEWDQIESRPPVRSSDILFGIDMCDPDSEYGGINNFKVIEGE